MIRQEVAGEKGRRHMLQYNTTNEEMRTASEKTIQTLRHRDENVELEDKVMNANFRLHKKNIFFEFFKFLLHNL